MENLQRKHKSNKNQKSKIKNNNPTEIREEKPPEIVIQEETGLLRINVCLADQDFLPTDQLLTFSVSYSQGAILKRQT